MQKPYVASLSRSQDREGWSVIFRHPVLKDRVTGRPGRRVRRGLGTRDQKRAEELVSQLNTILKEPEFWDGSARLRAESQFDAGIVEIFFDELVPELADYHSIRESVIPLPAMGGEYKRVLLAGTTGSGKTTLVRQLLGTKPSSERFPSTSAGKTTVADLEVVLCPGLFRAVVTFLPREQVRDLVEESMSLAALSAYRNVDQLEQQRLLLNHVNQRFRLSYVLGRGPFSEDEDGGDSSEKLGSNAGLIAQTNEVLTTALEVLPRIATNHAQNLWQELGAKSGDERVVAEIFEENLDFLLREDEEFQNLADSVMEEIEKRFELVPEGDFKKNKQGWPQFWTWETDQRIRFVEVVGRFASNYAGHFGTLLTPIVNGMRVAAPFKPTWAESVPRLVLFDGEGLGHTPELSASIPTSLSRRFDEVDAILIVDNAAQPMQAGPVQLMRSLASSGKTTKLLTCFTHMDLVEGDNLPTLRLQKQHVLASAENALTSVGNQLGPFAERALRQSMERGCFFVGGIKNELDPEETSGRRTIAEMELLLSAVRHMSIEAVSVAAKAVYDRVNLVLAARNAAQKFQEDWLVRLGFESRPGVAKEHWTRVKALSRRLGEGWDDEYGNLRPVADLYRSLQDDIYVFIQSPLKWEGADPSDEEKQGIFDSFARAISSRTLALAGRRIREERRDEWQGAYTKRGPGSTYQRATVIRDEIYERAAPVPDVSPSPDRNAFLHDVITIVEEASKEAGVVLQ